MISSHHSDLADFFAPDVFQAVLHDPATAIRLKAFCESSACGENVTFLEKIDQYSNLLEQARLLLSEIHATYTSSEAIEPINISERTSKSVTSAVDIIINETLPAMQDVFLDARQDVEDMIREDVYPRFVTHQMTSSAAMALAHDRDIYQGLGDCFCLTDPRIADNAIMYASDGFIKVTGYSRRDIVPRNCRFLQGGKTDRSSVTRLKKSIDNGQESVELLLNYRKDGSPFWNLLYVAPLFDEAGNIVYFLGGQIDCSTTVHGNRDVLKILGFDGGKSILQSFDDLAVKNGHSLHGLNPKDLNPKEQYRRRHSLWKPKSKSFTIKHGAGMEGDLIDRLGQMSMESQMEAFQTAYSKYLVVKIEDRAKYHIAHYSKAAGDLLRVSRGRGTPEPIAGEDIFKLLCQRSSSSSSEFKTYKKLVIECLAQGKAVSMDLEITVEEGNRSGGWAWPIVKTDKQLVSHWTPVKDEEGRARYVVLLFAER